MVGDGPIRAVDHPPGARLILRQDVAGFPVVGNVAGWERDFGLCGVGVMVCMVDTFLLGKSTVALGTDKRGCVGMASYLSGIACASTDQVISRSCDPITGKPVVLHQMTQRSPPWVRLMSEILSAGKWRCLIALCGLFGPEPTGGQCHSGRFDAARISSSSWLMARRGHLTAACSRRHFVTIAWLEVATWGTCSNCRSDR